MGSPCGCSETVGREEKRVKLGILKKYQDVYRAQLMYRGSYFGVEK